MDLESQPVLGEVLERWAVGAEVVALLVLADEARPWVERERIHLGCPDVGLFDECIQRVGAPLHVLSLVGEEFARDLDVTLGLFVRRGRCGGGVEPAAYQKEEFVARLVVLDSARVGESIDADVEYDLARGRVLFALVVLEAVLDALRRRGRLVRLTHAGELGDLEFDRAQQLQRLALALQDQVAQRRHIVVVELAHLAKRHGVVGVALLARLGTDACGSRESAQAAICCVQAAARRGGCCSTRSAYRRGSESHRHDDGSWL
ncbi:hypothetical protein L1887_61415 [Cichorium endivia]|nr:hypothetical protein L1887_61415 [Cichorium endivia]